MKQEEQVEISVESEPDKIKKVKTEEKIKKEINEEN